ncbi:MAG: domain containing protein [Firmicutes bacterium]|nr:domain containing protein [Bacillota bacterium]
MPGKVWIINVAGSILQYIFLFLIYYFIYRIVRVVIQDFRNSTVSFSPNSRSAIQRAGNPAKLIVVDAFPGHPAGEIILLGETTAIGRGTHNDIVIDDNFVSHEHSCITFYQNYYWLADLRSTNHTYQNDKIITEEVQLKNGDSIKVGRNTFKFEG